MNDPPPGATRPLLRRANRVRFYLMATALAVWLIFIYADQRFVDAGCLDKGGAWNWPTLTCSGAKSPSSAPPPAAP